MGRNKKNTVVLPDQPYFRVRKNKRFAIPGPNGRLQLFKSGDIVAADSPLVETHPQMLESLDGSLVTVKEAGPAEYRDPVGQRDLNEVTAPQGKTAPEREEKPEEPQEPEEAAAFDPGEHTVEQVNAHLDTVTDDAERERILQAERDGKNRSTIVG